MTTTTPPGILTGRPVPPGCRIGIPGFYHVNMLPTAPIAHRGIDPDSGRHDGSLDIGETEAHGPISLHYDTAPQVDALIVAAIIYRDWLEDA